MEKGVRDKKLKEFQGFFLESGFLRENASENLHPIIVVVYLTSHANTFEIFIWIPEENLWQELLRETVISEETIETRMESFRLPDPNKLRITR